MKGAFFAAAAVGALLASQWAPQPSPAQGTEAGRCLFDNAAASVAAVDYHFTDDQQASDSVQGTAFLVSSDGYLLTVAHVLHPIQEDVHVVTETVTVRFGPVGSTPIPATIVQRDYGSDLALLKIAPRPGGWPALPIGDSSTIDVGDTLTGLGFPGGDLAIVPTAQVTARTTRLQGQIKPWWQTALALNPGNSGGPIFNRSGTTVGLAVAVRENAQLITYVIPIQYAQYMLTAAGSVRSATGLCGSFPSCAHPSHGVDRYEIDRREERWSAWRDGGYNRTAYCNDFLGQLRSSYPNGQFEKVDDNEESRSDIFRHFEYRYFCAFRHTERPLYRTAAGPECVGGNH
jgi:S1-C subfamily serine protease